MVNASDWISLHVHYNSDMQSLLAEGVKPALEALRNEGLISGAFLIRYWEQGPHIRVRLRPRTPEKAQAAEIKFRELIGEFLVYRPSVYSFPARFMRVNFNDAYRREYGDAAFDLKYGAVGRIPFAPNNSIQAVEYEPESDRYGGEVGIAIAESHFEASSDAVLDVLASPNGADLSVRAGHALKFLVLGCHVFLRPEQRTPFLETNKARWMKFLEVYRIAVYDDMLEKYEKQRERLSEKIADWKDLLDGRRRPMSDERIIIPALRNAADALRSAHGRQLLDARHQAMSPERLMEAMLGSYLHMHCNRLGMLAVDEIYLSILGKEALAEQHLDDDREAA